MQTDSKFDPLKILADGPLEDVRNFLGGVGTEAVGEFFGSLPLSLLLLGRSMFKGNEGGVQGVNVKKEDNRLFLEAVLDLKGLCTSTIGQYNVYTGFFHYLAEGDDSGNVSLFEDLVKTLSRVADRHARTEMLFMLLNECGLSLSSRKQYGIRKTEENETQPVSVVPSSEELVEKYKHAVTEMRMYVEEGSALKIRAIIRQFKKSGTEAGGAASKRFRKRFGLPTKKTKNRK